jgi:hypothetical protein
MFLESHPWCDVVVECWDVRCKKNHQVLYGARYKGIINCWVIFIFGGYYAFFKAIAQISTRAVWKELGFLTLGKFHLGISVIRM